MRILVKEHSGTRIWLPIPTWLAFNPLTARIMPKYLEEAGISVTPEQAAVFVRELNRQCRLHKGLKLVEVHSAQGDHIVIRL